MTDHPVCHDGMRPLQDRFGTRVLADRLSRHRRREAVTAEDRAFTQGQSCFLLATATKVPAWKTFPQFADALPGRGQKEPRDG